MLEFQSTVDYLMPLRIRNYVDSFHMEQWRGRRFRSTDRLAPVLPIVLYIGASPWTAAQQVIDLVTPEAAQAGGEEANAAWATPAGSGESGARWRADPRFAGDGYVVLDSLRVGPEDLRRDNAAALLAGLESPTEETIAGLLAALNRRLRAPGAARVEEGHARVGGVAGETAVGAGAGGGRHGARGPTGKLRRCRGVLLGTHSGMEGGASDRGPGRRSEEGRPKAGRKAGPKAGRKAGRKAGKQVGKQVGGEGRVVGQRESLRRHAAMKFDAETAARLGAVLEGVTDQAVLDGVLAALLQCDTPSELLARATEARRRTNGRNAPAEC